MSIRYWALVLLVLLGNLGVAQAASLQMYFSPSSTTVTVGGSFWVDFAISGLYPNVPTDIISAFDVDVTFAPTLLSVTDIIFGTQLGEGDDQESDSSLAFSGVADLSQASWWLTDDELKQLQPGSTVTLGRLEFIALAAGTSWLDFAPMDQTVSGALDEDGIAILHDMTTQPGSVTINPGQNTNPVPEPATLLLMSIGLTGLAAQRRRRHQQGPRNSKNNHEETL